MKYYLSFFSVLSLLLNDPVDAGNFPNVDRDADLRSGARANIENDLGIPRNPVQATLIHPRVAVSAFHGGIQGWNHEAAGQAAGQLQFGDSHYNIISRYGPPGSGAGVTDYTLLFLDRPVTEVAPRPLAEFNGGMTRDLLLHFFSYNQGITHQGQSLGNRHGDLQYGRAYMRAMRPSWTFVSVGTGTPQTPAHEIQMDAEDLVVPIGGDSGSPTFAQTEDGRFALIGPVTTVGDGKNASYTYLTQYKADIEARIGEFLQGQGVSNPQVALQTITSDQFQHNPDSLSNDRLNLGGQQPPAPAQQPVAVPSSVPPHFNPELYARLYPDLAGNSDEWLRGHYVNHGISEGRRILPEGFDPDYYINAYDDLRSSTEGMTLEDKRQWARTHYANHGASENRMFQIPTHFNSDVYLQLHVDLLGAVAGISDPVAREDWARTHYKNHGVVEGRATLPNGLEDAEALWEHMLLLDGGEFFEQLGDTLTNEQKLQRTRERVVQDWLLLQGNE